MKTHFKFLFLISFCILVFSCGTIKKFSNKKTLPAKVKKKKTQVIASSKVRQISANKKNKIPISYSSISGTSFPKGKILNDKIILEAKKYLGAPYKYGGSKKGVDCSGLMVLAFSPYKIKIPRSALSQSKQGRLISKNQIKKGDLLFFATGQEKKITHVALVTKLDDKQIFFIHASTSKGVIISNLSEPYWAKRFVFAKRII